MTFDAIGFVLYYRFKYKYKRRTDVEWTETWSYWSKYDTYKIYNSRASAIEAANYVLKSNIHAGCECKIAPVYLNQLEFEEII